MSDRANRTGLYEMPPSPELPDLFRVALRDMALQLATHSVAKVLAYNPTTQTVKVEVQALAVLRDNTAQATPGTPNPTTTLAPMVLNNLKVAWPRTAAGYLTFPLVPGDTGELHVQDRSIDLWRKSGVPTNPRSAFIHMLGDSVFHPNIHQDDDPITPPTSLAAAVLEGPLVNLGAKANEPLLKGATVSAAVTTYTSAVAAAFATWSAIVPPTVVSNAAFIAALGAANAALATTIPTWISTKVFTE